LTRHSSTGRNRAEILLHRCEKPVTGQPQYWDPVNGNFSAIPFIYGTLVSSFLSLLFAVPLAIGVAIFLTEMCPRFLRGPLAFLTELLAAIPSIIYGLWPSLCWSRCSASMSTPPS